MSKYLGSLGLVLLGVACGGSTGTGDESGDAGTSSGGSGSHAGSGHGGEQSAGSSSGGAAGKAMGGNSMGGSIGEGGSGGVGGGIIIAGSGGVGGGGVVDPRCPATRPTGKCSGEALSCQYDYFTGCLCYPQPGNFIYGFCQKVDPTCTGAAGAAAAPPPDRGVGGFTTKIAVAPPQMVCTCVGDLWSCSTGLTP